VSRYHLIIYPAFSLLLLASCSGKQNISSDPRLEQYYVQGQLLYQKHCSNCHQTDGSGLGRLYPPVNHSDYVDNNLSDVICLIRYGKKGSLLVNGIEYNMEMKGIGTLSDLEIAEIATYLYNNWSRQQGLVDVQEAATILSSCQK
jgi:cytochrome c551